MKSILFGAALTLTGISLATTGAEAKGCIKGALVGGVAGQASLRGDHLGEVHGAALHRIGEVVDLHDAGELRTGAG